MKICDRCGKEMEDIGTGILITMQDGIESKDLCKDCVIDMVNIIEMELKPEEAKVYDVDYKEI